MNDNDNDIDFSGQWMAHDESGGMSAVIDGERTTIDSDTEIEWSRLSTHGLGEPYDTFFGTDAFHALSVVAARPIRQSYNIDGQDITLKKPASELAAGAMTLSDRPWTIGHPKIGRVMQRDSIEGIVRNPSYNYETDSLEVDVYIPQHSQTAKNALSSMRDVSVGFYNTVDTDTTEKGVDGLQRDLIFDHLASVRSGRCSAEQGCEVKT